MIAPGNKAGPPAYCPYYCEENIWQLCADPAVLGQHGQALLIANQVGYSDGVAVWQQRAGTVEHGAGGLVVWDYHVIAAGYSGQAWQVWDLDSRLGYPWPALDYLAETFAPVPARYAPHFRVIDATAYRQLLASDRRHMRTDDGRYLQAPPDWPTPGVGFNLDRLIDMGDDIAGRRLDLEALMALWSRAPEAA